MSLSGSNGVRERTLAYVTPVPRIHSPRLSWADARLVTSILDHKTGVLNWSGVEWPDGSPTQPALLLWREMVRFQNTSIPCRTFQVVGIVGMLSRERPSLVGLRHGHGETDAARTAPSQSRQSAAPNGTNSSLSPLGASLAAYPSIRSPSPRESKPAIPRPFLQAPDARCRAILGIMGLLHLASTPPPGPQYPHLATAPAFTKMKGGFFRFFYAGPSALPRVRRSAGNLRICRPSVCLCFSTSRIG